MNFVFSDSIAARGPAKEGISFNSDIDIPDLSGKVIIVTGGNSGLGKATIHALARHNPARIYLAGRSETKCKAAIEEIKTDVLNTNVSFLECDLSSLESVKKAAESFLQESQRLDLLLCNAGIMVVPPGLTADGCEIQFGTNHLAHALLIKLLLPTLLRTTEEHGDARIVCTSSQAFGFVDTIKFPELRSATACDSGPLGGRYRYGQSKLANILYAAELARRYPTIKAVSVHPGIVATGIGRELGFTGRMFNRVVSRLVGQKWTTPEEGAHTQLWAATAPQDKVENGAYYEPVAVPGRHTEASKNAKLEAKLWEWAESELKNWCEE